MGASYKFRCRKCGYEAEVAGEKSFGMFARTETKRCTECNTITDVTTSYQDWFLKKNPELKDNLNKCGNCSSTKAVPWDGRCPRCDELMEKGELVGLWD